MIIPVLYAQANVKYTGTSVPRGAEVTLGLNKELWAGSAAGAAQEVLNAFQSTAMKALLPSTITIASCLMKFGPNTTGAAAEVSGPVVGTSPNASASPNVAYLVRKNTGFGGRTGRGRMYFPGAGEPNVDAGGNVLAAHVTAWNSALEAMRTALVALGLVPTLLHGAGSPVTSPMPITSFSTDSKVATQRRRLRG